MERSKTKRQSQEKKAHLTKTDETGIKEYQMTLTSVYQNVIYQLLKLLAVGLKDEVLKQLTALICQYTINLINDEYKRAIEEEQQQKQNNHEN